MTENGNTRQRTALERRARRRARYTTALLWHGGSFAIVNTAFWLLDARGPGAIDWAFWITAPWAFALAFHALAWLIDGHDLEERLTRDYLDAARRRTGAERHPEAPETESSDRLREDDRRHATEAGDEKRRAQPR